MFTFSIGGQMMGLDARFIYRVLEDIVVAPVCFTPPCYMGLVYYRGELFDVVDLARLLELSEKEAEEKCRYIVVRWPEGKMALAVRRIAGLLWIEGDPEEAVCTTGDGDPVHILTPDRIWDKLRSLPYGPVQI